MMGDHRVVFTGALSVLSLRGDEKKILSCFWHVFLEPRGSGQEWAASRGSGVCRAGAGHVSFSVTVYGYHASAGTKTGSTRCRCSVDCVTEIKK